MAKKPATAVKVASVPPAPAKPATPPVISQSGAADTYRTALRGVARAAAVASISREVLVERIAAVAKAPDGRALRDIRDAVHEGYIAGRIARAAGRDVATPEDHAAAIVVLAKANVLAAKPSAAGKRTAEEERFFGGARALWHGLAISAEAAPEAGTNTGRAVGGKASAAKRAARQGGTGGRNVGTTTVKTGAAAKASGTKTGPALTSNVPPAATRSDAIAGAMHIAAQMLAFAQHHEKVLGSPHAKKIMDAARVVLNLPMVTEK